MLKSDRRLRSDAFQGMSAQAPAALWSLKEGHLQQLVLVTVPPKGTHLEREWGNVRWESAAPWFGFFTELAKC